MNDPQDHPVGVIGMANGNFTMDTKGTWAGKETVGMVIVLSPKPFNENNLDSLENGNVEFRGLVIRFEGTVDGCGQGSMVLMAQARVVPYFKAPEPLSWSIVPNLGTGDLAKTTGSGTWIRSVEWGNREFTTGSEIFSGSMSCAG